MGDEMANRSDADQRNAVLPELVDLVSAACPRPGLQQTAWPALSLIRAVQTVERLPSLYEPSLCIVVQGRKRAQLGAQSYTYDPGHFLVVSTTLPVIARIEQASAERPFLCMRLGIDPAAVAELLVHAADSVEVPGLAGPALYVEQMSESLAAALLRLLRALEQPAELAVLGPMIIREIYFRVIQGGMGAQLRALVDGAGQAQRMAAAVELIKRRFDQSWSVAELAAELHVSPSTLHHRFKQLTSMTPLQFQKQLRLHEARRLMFNAGLGAAEAGHRVGYGSPSQFSRDFRRLFGQPPKRALARIDAAA